MLDTIIVDNVIIHLSKLIKHATQRVKPKVNYELWEITICHCWFISYNKCTAVIGVLLKGQAMYACVGQGVMGLCRGLSLHLPLNFAVT